MARHNENLSLEEVIGGNPNLHGAGNGYDFWIPRGDRTYEEHCEQRKQFFEDYRRMLEGQHDYFLAAREWIERNMRPTKTIRPCDSYYLKHVMERETGKYVSNGAFIAAAISLGYRHTEN
jgi:hypothetical protein